jgi:hypothetical protein
MYQMMSTMKVGHIIGSCESHAANSQAEPTHSYENSQTLLIQLNGKNAFIDYGFHQ